MELQLAASLSVQRVVFSGEFRVRILPSEDGMLWRKEENMQQTLVICVFANLCVSSFSRDLFMEAVFKI